MKLLVVCAVILAGCAADRPTASQKIVVQEFGCEVVFSDTLFRAIRIRDTRPDVGGLHRTGGDIWLRDITTYNDGEQDLVYGFVYGDSVLFDVHVGLYMADPFERHHRERIELFTDPRCNASLRTLLSSEIASSTHKLEQYTLAARQLDRLAETSLLDPNCGFDCWKGVEVKRERIQEQYEFYKGELRYAKALYEYFFEHKFKPCE